MKRETKGAWIYLAKLMSPFILAMVIAPFTSDGCSYDLVMNKPFVGDATGRYRICEQKPSEWTVEFEQTGLFGSRWRHLRSTYWYASSNYISYWDTKHGAIKAAREHHAELGRQAIYDQFEVHCDTILTLVGEH